RSTTNFVDTYGDRLAQVHGPTVGRENRNKPLAIRDIIVRQAEFLRPEQQCDSFRRHGPANEASARSQQVERMLDLAMSYSCSTNHQRAVRDRIGDAFELLRGLKDGRGAHGRNGLPERDMIRVDDAQRIATEVL